MRRLRPALAATAALSLTAAAVPALAAPSATRSTPSKGSAQSTLTLLDLALANHSLRLGSIAGVATTATHRTAQLVVTPAQLDGTSYGQQTVTPSSAPSTVDGSGKTVSIPSVLDATGPTFGVDAQAGPTAVLTSAALKALGQLTLKPADLLSFPIDLTAAKLDNLSKVTATQAEATKSVTIGSLSLPSLDELLGALGVKVPALLPLLSQQALTTLGNLVGVNGLAALNTAVDTAQGKLQNAADTLAGASAALQPAKDAATTAQSTLATATGTLTTANAAFDNAFGALSSGALAGLGVATNLTPVQFLALAPATRSAVDALTAADLVALANSAVSAQTAVDAATAALAAAQAVVANVQALIDALQALVDAVLGAVTGNSNPLATLGNITVTTKAVATTTSTPTPVAEAKVGSLKILGNDAVASQLTSAVGGVMTTLAGVLNSVAGVRFTPPAIAIGSGKTDTTTSGTTRQASASITGLTLTLPSIQLPSQLSTVTQAVPNFATIANGVTSILGGQLQVATLNEAAAMTPGTTASTPDNPSSPTDNPATPSTPASPSSPSLAHTGLATTLPLSAALLILAALAVAHRRRATAELDS